MWPSTGKVGKRLIEKVSLLSNLCCIYKTLSGPRWASQFLAPSLEPENCSMWPDPMRVDVVTIWFWVRSEHASLLEGLEGNTVLCTRQPLSWMFRVVMVGSPFNLAEKGAPLSVLLTLHPLHNFVMKYYCNCFSIFWGWVSSAQLPHRTDTEVQERVSPSYKMKLYVLVTWHPLTMYRKWSLPDF